MQVIRLISVSAGLLPYSAGGGYQWDLGWTLQQKWDEVVEGAWRQ